MYWHPYSGFNGWSVHTTHTANCALRFQHSRILWATLNRVWSSHSSLFQLVKIFQKKNMFGMTMHGSGSATIFAQKKLSVLNPSSLDPLEVRFVIQVE